MKKISVLLLIFALTTFFLSTLRVQANETQATYTDKKQPKPRFTPLALTLSLQSLFTSRTSDSGLLNTGYQMVFGPLACTAFGDPYSPFNSPFRPPGTPAGPYTYQYRILIPPSYPDDTLRVELFDPDSHNSPTNSATVIHTNYAANNGFPATENLDCINNGQPGSSPRQNICLLASGEESLISPLVTVDQINPFWFMRVDENRGPAPSNCGAPGTYNVAYNTATLYQLSYFQQNSDGTIQPIPLSSYTGRIDNVAPHDTDLSWVSPGAPPGLGRSTVVPVDAGSAKTFQLDLNTDVPNIVTEASTGNRYIYLNVTTIAGSSRNGFDIWAGPDDYINAVPSEVNERNIFMLDSPGAHDSAGVVILADHVMPQSVYSNQVVERPLAYFGPEYAGQTLSLTMFDVDTFTQAPITFTFDTIDPADWSLTFGIPGTIDPDGVSADSRCFPNCNNQFITPSYVITIPGGINCNPPVCTPFTGGRLLMRYAGTLIHDGHLVSLTVTPFSTVSISGPITGTLGSSNTPTFIAQADFITTALPITYTWQATAQLPVTHTNGLSDTVTFRWPVPGSYTITVAASNGLSTVSDTHQIVIYPAAPIPGCASFPIAIQEGIRSVNPPSTGTSNDYPQPGDFHPNSPMPFYFQFPNNVPDLPLHDAQEGYIFKLPNGISSGNMAWLVWNNGIVASSGTLENSLLVPGNSTDYSDHGDGGQPATPLYPHVVRGYVNPLDVSDLIMQPGDWVTADTGSVNSNGVRDQINWLITNGFELPVVVWDTWLPANGDYYLHIVHLAVFRLHGHNLSQSGNPSWLLAEFVRWQTVTCPEEQFPVEQVAINGPGTGTVDIDYDFTATVVPSTTTQPITYTWQTSGQPPITHTGGISDTAVFQWPTPGPKTITVTASNSLNSVTATHHITISQPALPDPMAVISLTGPITGFMDIAYDFTAVITPTTAQQPITYTWQTSGQPPITHTGGISDTAVFQWPTPGPKTITVTASNSLNSVTATHHITINQPALPDPIAAISLTGPITGFVDVAYDFTAVITPTTAQQPITYTWQTSGQPPITHTGGISDSLTFTWSISGTKTITVVADNGIGQPVTAVHTITIELLETVIKEWLLYLPYISKS